MCLVEIKGRRGYPPSCGTYVEEGMEIVTDSPKLLRLRRDILQLILTEHPNACLICSEKESCDDFKSTIRKVAETTGCVLCSNNRRCELQDVVDALKLEKVGFPSVYRDFEIKKEDPFFDRNYNLCILCGRCVRVCHELRGASAIAFVNRGPDEVVGTVLDKPLLESGCQFCGACVDVCPTGSLAERGLKYESLPDREVKTICPLCSLGCELDVWLKDGRILSASPSSDGTVNRGQACFKGRFLIRDIVYSPQRSLSPLIKIKGKFVEVSWDEALDFVAEKIRTYKGAEMAFVESQQLTCEDIYLGRKFARDVLKTKNIDTCAVFSPYEDLNVAAQISGSPTKLNFDINDLSGAQTIVLSGADIVKSHPIVWLEVLKAVKNGSKLVVVSPTEFLLKRFSTQWLRIKPGSESVLFGYLAKFLLEGFGDKKPQISGLTGFAQSLEKLKDSDCLKLTGVDEKVLKKVSKLFANGDSTVFLYGAGLAQFPSDANNASSIRNLALLCGAQVIPLCSGCNDRGLYELMDSSQDRKVARAEILQSVSEGKIKGMYRVGSAAIPKEKQTEFLVVQNSYFDENSEKADVFLPATTFAETEGAYVNLEGRIQMSHRVIDPLGEARPDWWIFSEIARRMKVKGFEYKKSADILKEIRQTFPRFSKASSSGLEKGNEIFMKEEKRGPAGLSPVKFGPSAEEISRKYPLKLILRLDPNFYRNLSLSSENKGFAAIQNSRWIRINPEDAEKWGFKNDDPLVVESSDGKMEGVVKVSSTLPRGLIESQFLWNEETRISGFDLIFPLSKGHYPQEPIPVKVKRGK
jgi:predicted molibdopterin-dependent oxidoreductase YjgC